MRSQLERKYAMIRAANEVVPRVRAHPVYLAHAWSPARGHPMNSGRIRRALNGKYYTILLHKDRVPARYI